ncbi:MAG: DNA polymerase beta superfamily protein [Bacteroidota bacterium]
MTVQELKDKKCVIFECISGSQAYGLATEKSDVDIKGVFILPKENFYSLEYVDQINESNNNVVFFELKKFIELLSKNNPNMLEMLSMPEDCILFRHPLYDSIGANNFLSKLCKDTFAGYAMTQLKKARGLNKKILNPVSEKKKSVLDFCYVIKDQGSIPVNEFLKINNIRQEECGLVVIPHMKDVYGLYYHPSAGYKGIIQDELSKDVSLSSVKENEIPVAILSFNKDGYSKYCKDYKEYFEWVENRNDVRYQNTISHGKNYDSKNMMHTFRLLDMAEEIGRTGKINVRRPNRDYLLDIKSGKFGYEDLISAAEKKLEDTELAYQVSSLPQYPDLFKINCLLVEIRRRFYRL